MMIISSESGAVDVHSSSLPDGRRAHLVPQHELYRVLAKIGVPNIAATQGVQELVGRFANYQAAQKPDPWTGKAKERKPGAKS